MGVSSWLNTKPPQFNGRKMRALRRKLLLSQEALALKLSVSRQMVNYWETGARSPDVDRFRAIMIALGCTPQELVDRAATKRRAHGTAA